MKLWKIIMAHLVIVCLIGCTSTAKMTALDRSLVNKKITRTATGGVKIDMDGSFILNPTAAIETFHAVAEKEMGGRPYRYSYVVDKKQTTRQIPDHSSTATAASAGSSHTPVYTPIYVPAGGGGGGGGEAAVILGSIALIILLAKMASSSREEKAPEAPSSPAATPTPAAAPAAPREEVITTRVLRVSGTAEPVAPVTLDRNRLVEVLLPDQSPVIGKLKPAVAKALSEEIRRGFESMGCQVLLGSQSRQSGYTVRTSVLRSQGNAIVYSNLTVEITLMDQKTGHELARWIVQASEKPFDLKSQNERLYGAGIATGILQKPLKTQINRYLR